MSKIYNALKRNEDSKENVSSQANDSTSTVMQDTSYSKNVIIFLIGISMIAMTVSITTLFETQKAKLISRSLAHHISQQNKDIKKLLSFSEAKSSNELSYLGNITEKLMDLEQLILEKETKVTQLEKKYKSFKSELSDSTFTTRELVKRVTGLSREVRNIRKLKSQQ